MPLHFMELSADCYHTGDNQQSWEATFTLLTPWMRNPSDCDWTDRDVTISMTGCEGSMMQGFRKVQLWCTNPYGPEVMSSRLEKTLCQLGELPRPF